MSTARDTVRSPARASRTRIRSGVAAAGSKPRISRSTNRSHAVGSPMLAACTWSDTAAKSGGRSASAGSVNRIP